MKKMVEQNTINKSNALFEGMTADANGNVTVGKNLEVDGTITINTATDLKTKDGTTFGNGKLYQHMVNVELRQTTNNTNVEANGVIQIINKSPNPFNNGTLLDTWLKENKGWYMMSGYAKNESYKGYIQSLIETEDGRRIVRCVWIDDSGYVLPVIGPMGYIGRCEDTVIEIN